MLPRSSATGSRRPLAPPPRARGARGGTLGPPPPPPSGSIDPRCSEPMPGMHIRVVTSQPWDIEADLLALPIVADHEPDDTATELDRRIEGALAAYRALGEQAGKAHAGTIIRGRETAAPWLLAMGVGDLAAFDRLAALRFGAAIERRLGGRGVRRLAVWLPA